MTPTGKLPQQLPPSPGLARLRAAQGGETARRRVLALQGEALRAARTDYVVPGEVVLPYGNGCTDPARPAGRQNLVYALCRRGQQHLLSPQLLQAWSYGREGMGCNYAKRSTEHAAWTAGRDERRLVERR